MSNKKRFVRGRRPGVKLSRNKKAKTNARPHLQRFSMSIPVELARTVKKLKPMLDLEYSKMFRYGFGLAMDKWLKNGRIDRKTYDEYQTARHLFRDEDFGVPDLDREPTEEEFRSASDALVPRPKNVLTKIIESKPRITRLAAPTAVLGAS